MKVEYQRILFYLIALLAVSECLLRQNISAQPVSDTANYLLRDEAGNVMTPEEMEKVTITISGISLKLRYDIFNKEPVYYEYEFVQYFRDRLIRDTGKILFSNPITITTYLPSNGYGTVRDLTLIYRGKEMRLFFDFERAPGATIDSLPFQSGAFYLNPSMTQECKESKPCIVSSANWEDASKNWVRQPIWNKIWITALNPRFNDCNQTNAVINNQSDWAKVWEFYQEKETQITIHQTKERYPAPAVDFKSEVVLLTYFHGTGTQLKRDSFSVDSNGNLTFRPPALAKPWLGRFCSMLVVEFYRSGVKSVEGKPLPPPEI